MHRIILFLCIAFILPVQLNANDLQTWLKSTHSINDVLSGNRLAINYNGFNLIVKLVCVELVHDDKAKAHLKEILDDNEVTLIPEDFAKLTPEGYQPVYAFYKKGKKRIFINDLMLKSGFCKFRNDGSIKFKKFNTILKESSYKHKPIVSEESSAGKKEEIVEDRDEKEELAEGFCSELHSRKYHLTSCKWAKYMDESSRILYDSQQAAEKANKSPCYHCLYDRVKALRLAKSKSRSSQSSSSSKSNSVKELKGYLYGHESNNTFYSPVSKKLAKLKQSGLIQYASLKEARASGRKPDLGSLRIDNPVVPKPTGKECIGRALPYMRPCRRETDHATGLCEPCLNGRIR